ncbi:class I SAM-dependent methyltransferase [Nakamurella deserti]|uniref:class I SAM-dependent methyltransferase n=1 Tax=Nakamurella deserti TaxID=2164074 RepID=UPI000DBE84D6|nr:class I SAM-dependent methyltransferase [Nakamurella deserti]
MDVPRRLGRRSTAWRGSLRRGLLVPRVAVLGSRAPRDPLLAWQRYWAGISTTGSGGEVLWDVDEDDEFDRYRELLLRHTDVSLPVVDLGCGNGRFTRRLATVYPRAIGVDVAAAAVDRARAETAADPRVEFRTVDVTAAGAVAALAAELGPVNLFVRGVLHVLDRPAQRRLAAGARQLVGGDGRLLLAETAFRGSGLQYLESLGAGPRAIPMPLARAIGGLPRPGAFGAAERAAAFPSSDWTVLVEGDTHIRAVPMRTTSVPEEIPGYLAVLAARTPPSGAPATHSPA